MEKQTKDNLKNMDRTIRNPMPQKPLVSVIMPMKDHRGIALQAVESWVRLQRCNPNDFEVILIIDDSMNALASALKPLLRSHDAILNLNTTIETEQYDYAARRAQGEYLFFTESHCMAEPDAISETIAYIQTHSLDGFCAHDVPICPNRIAKVEAKMFAQGFQEWSKEDHWMKVILRGVAIRKAAYMDVGGFHYKYDRFSEWLLAAMLHAKGYRLGYAPKVRVRHCYNDNFQLLEFYIKTFTIGECVYRLEGDPELCQRYFAVPSEWNELNNFDSSLVRSIFGDLFKRITIDGAWNDRKKWLKQALSIFHLVIFGANYYVLRYSLFVNLAKLRLHLRWNDETEMVKAFIDFYMGCTSLTRACFVRDHVRKSDAVPRVALAYPMDDLKTESLWGFHEIERYEGVSFRWSSSIAALKLNLAPADYDGVIKLVNVRPINVEKDAAIYLNGMPIQSLTYNALTCELSFFAPYTMFSQNIQQRMVLLTELLKSDGRDARSLGLPIVSVHFKPHGRNEK
jgi:hypothetical protein